MADTAEVQLVVEGLAEFAHSEHIGGGGGFEVPRDADHGVVGETGPVGGVGAIQGERDGG